MLDLLLIEKISIMSSLRPLNIVFLKIGFLGSSLLPEILLDERSTREDINIYSFSTGCNMNVDNVEKIVKISRSFDPHLIIFISPAMEKEQIKKKSEECISWWNNQKNEIQKFIKNKINS